MIVSFSVSNFRSFGLEEETFSMVASKRIGDDHSNHTMPIPGSKERVLRAAVIYGANGAGKSNLFKALSYFVSLVLRPADKNSGTGREPFKLTTEKNLTTSFDLQFIAGEKLYRFGAVIDDSKIIEEWLVRVSGKKETLIYERITDDTGSVSVKINAARPSKKLSAAATVGGRPNMLFLATINELLESKDIGRELNEIIYWFDSQFRLIGPDANYHSLESRLAEDKDFLKFTAEFLKSLETGVESINPVIEEMTEEEINRSPQAAAVRKILDKPPSPDADKTIVKLAIAGAANLIMQKSRDGKYSRISLKAIHRDNVGREVQMEIEEESDGTIRLLNLLPVLYIKSKRDNLFFIDEVERSMHSMLAKKFVEFFLKSLPDCRRQLIVTTHESNLLDLDLLRRDEIYFAEKDSHGATHIYSLSDFKVRKDLEIRKHYLDGRFGAIPFLGNIDHLMSEGDASIS
jgi:AAA15 family ATPase/GTPase